MRAQLPAIWRAPGVAARRRSHLPQIGRGQARQRRRRDKADRRPGHVRRRFSAQGGAVGREFGHELCRRSAAAGRHPQCIAGAAALAGERAALRAGRAGAIRADPERQHALGAGPARNRTARVRPARALRAGERATRARHAGVRTAGAGGASRSAAVDLRAWRGAARRHSRRRRAAARPRRAVLSAHAAGV